MSVAAVAELTLKGGDPSAALAQLQEQVRTAPSDPGLRIFLFQLLCVLGQWERALNQLEVASTLDPGALAMAHMYGDAIRCELVRTEVFAGRKSPLVFGQPEEWLALLIESRIVAGLGDIARAEELRLQAFAAAPASIGDVDGRPFGWIADADSRLGPVLEAVINGRYYWVPFARLSRVVIDAPVDLRDVVWMPAHFEFENGGESVGLIPTRYPGSQAAEDGAIALARKTVWEEVAPDAHHGLGQRLFATDSEDIALMEIRAITLTATVDHE